MVNGPAAASCLQLSSHTCIGDVMHVMWLLSLKWHTKHPLVSLWVYCTRAFDENLKWFQIFKFLITWILTFYLEEKQFCKWGEGGLIGISTIYLCPPFPPNKWHSPHSLVRHDVHVTMGTRVWVSATGHKQKKTLEDQQISLYDLFIEGEHWMGHMRAIK